MRFSLIKNGADSLKNASINLERIEGLEEGKDHNLKDAVIFLNHGIEILLKVILSERSFALMFDNIKEYQKAKIEQSKTDKKDIFEVNPNLKTVSLTEALNRVEYLCDIEVNEEMKNAIMVLNRIRNKLMHYSIDLNITEMKELINKLKFTYAVVHGFFKIHIDNFDLLIGAARFELTREELEIIMQEMYEDDIRREEEERRELEYEAMQYGYIKKNVNFGYYE